MKWVALVGKMMLGVTFIKCLFHMSVFKQYSGRVFFIKVFRHDCRNLRLRNSADRSDGAGGIGFVITCLKTTLIIFFYLKKEKGHHWLFKN